ARPDTPTTYRHGWKLEQPARLSGVDATSKPLGGTATAPRELTRRSHLSYDHATHASLLTNVQLEGRGEEPVLEDANQSLPVTSCPRLPAVTLEYQRVDSASPGLPDSNGLAFEPMATEVSEVEASPEHSVDQSHVDLF